MPVPVFSQVTFIVNSEADLSDELDDDAAACDTGETIEGGAAECTLRAAIEEANRTPEKDTINFAIPESGLKTILPGKALPIISEPVIIDGTSQEGYVTTPIIEIDGSDASGVEVFGLEVVAGNSTIKGLAINSFTGTGLVLRGGDQNMVKANHIGTNAPGSAAKANKLDGIAIIDSGLNVIGGADTADRNLISGNTGFGIVILNSPSNDNTVIGNYIGTDVTGLSALGNGRAGVLLSAVVGETQFTSNNIIGGVEAGEGNVISGNGQDGIEIFHSDRNQVIGNLIGVDQSGTAPLKNTLTGVRIGDGADNHIGNDTDGAGNVISGNGLDGIVIGGVLAIGNRIEANYIGTDSAGEYAIDNGRVGVLLTSFGTGLPSSGTVVGSEFETGVSNVISGNGRDGIQIGFGSEKNKIIGNKIGVSADGASAISNVRHGVAIFDSSDNIVGGSLPREANIISGNEGVGVFVKGEDVTGIVVRGNYIGTNPDESEDIGNSSYGIHIKDASETKIGGLEKDQGNTIAFNGSVHKQRGHGIVIDGGTKNAIRANSIFENSGRGIDLVDENFEVTTPYAFTIPDPADPNAGTAADADTGSNDLLNYALVTDVKFSGGQKTIEWTVYGGIGDIYEIDIFSNEEADPSGFGEGRKYLKTRNVLVDSIGHARFTETFNLESTNGDMIGPLISTTTTDLDNNTSEFSMIDTDGDAIADQWEILGIDIDEDGVIDFPIPGVDLPMSNFKHKDVFVEVDAMACTIRLPSGAQACFAPTAAEQASVVSAFATVPAQFINNPDGQKGVTLHFDMDETIVHHSWVSIIPGDKVTGWQFFDDVKNNGSVFEGGGFGTPEERINPNAIAAKKLFYRYAIFADHFGEIDSSTNLQVATGISGIAEPTWGPGPAFFFVDGGNDFFITLGEWTIPGGNSSQRTGTFMHEMGHTLGLMHGGLDHTNNKPNYHSVMNYIWQSQESSYPQGWMLDYSRTPFITLFEGALSEAPGVGGPAPAPGTPPTLTVVGPPEYWPTGTINRRGEDVGGAIRFRRTLVREDGPTDFDNDGVTPWNETGVSADLNNHGDEDYNNDGEFDVLDKQGPPETLISNADWTSLRFNFLGTPNSADGKHEEKLSIEEITLEDFQSLESTGDGVGSIGFVVTQIEVDENAGNVGVTVRRIDGWAGDVTVDFQTMDITTTAGLDYIPVSGTLDFIEGEIFRSFQIEILDDIDAEDDEALQIQLSNPQGGAILELDQFFLGIKKNDGPGDLQFINPFFGVQEDASSATITVVRTGGSDGVVEVDFSTADDLALASEDYTSTSGQLVFADGVTSQTFVVQITEDILFEGNEGINLTLSNPLGGAILGSIDEATLTILNVPTPVAAFNFSLPIYKVDERDGAVSIKVTRSKVLDTAVSVDLVTTDDSALMGADYTQTNITLNFAANEVSKIVDIPILEDTVPEVIETFDLSLVNPSQFALIGPIGEASVRIRDLLALTVTNTNDNTPGSLRWAINRVNARDVPSVIDFDIPGTGVHTIKLESLLPIIFKPVVIDGYTQLGSSPNTLDTNTNAVLLIELDGSAIPPGFPEPPITERGLIQFQAQDVTVRGLVITSFLSHGILGVNAQNAVIEGNFIGTDAKGLQSKRVLRGIRLTTGSNNNLIGGATPAARNLISGSGIGIVIDSGSSGNVIMGNIIGIGADGRELGNEAEGILLVNAKNTTIGGPDELEGNVIAFNWTAISIGGLLSTATGNSVRGNSIYESSFSGLRVLGPEGNVIRGWLFENDAGDVDGGSNLLQNYPVIGDVQSTSGETTFAGYLASATNTTFTLDFYSSPSVHRDGYGEGKNYLGSGPVTTDEDGTGMFNIILPVDLAPGEFITATATDPGKNTSPFSLRQAVGAVLTQTLVVNSKNDVDDGFCNSGHCSLHEAIRAANNYAGPNTINFAIEGAGPHSIALIKELPPITESVLIDGYSQPGASANTLEIASNAHLLIEIDGSDQEKRPFSNSTGPLIELLGQNSIIRGLAINRDPGILIRGAGHRIEGNFLGTDVTGTTYLGGGNITAEISSSSQTTIGGPDIKHRNLIAAQVTFQGGAGHKIMGNLIGTDITGSFLLSPGFGIATTTDGVMIGGSGPGEGNVIASGIGIRGTNTIVQGNLIGTDATGTQAIARQLPFIHGIVISGININDQHGNQIGGSSPGEGNVISGHGGHGIDVRSGPPIEQNFIQGNFIGTDRSGTLNLGNKLDGIHIIRSGLVIGGETPGSANIIAHNGGAGVSTDKLNTLISQNSIHDNGGLGIDLNSDGVTPNDEGDSDSGGNNRQNFPVISTVTAMSGETTVNGSLSSMPDTSYRLEFFTNDFSDPSGYGEGKAFIGFIDVMTDNAGDAAFSPTFPGELSIDQAVTATATDPEGNTSEFSFRRALGGLNISADLTVSQVANPNPVPLDAPLTFNITVTNNGPDVASGVVLSNPLESDSVFISAESEQGSCSFSNFTVSCPIGIIPAAGSVEVSITYKEVYVHTLANTVVVTGNQPDPDTLNNSNTIEVEIVPNADLEITKTADQETVSNGDTVTYTLDIANLGPSTVVPVTVIDTLPAGFTPVSVDSRRADCSIMGNTITCSFYNVYTGDTNSVTIVATVKGDGIVTNTAEIMGDVFDANMDNNSSSVDITIVPATGGIFKDSFEELEQ